MRILGIAYGAHNSGVCLLEDGKVLVSLEEERHSRIKPYVDFYNNWFRYPIQSLAELFGRMGYSWKDVDYVASHNSFEDVQSVLKCLAIDFVDRERFIWIDHHDCHAFGAFFSSGFQDDTLNLAIDGAGFGYSAKYYYGRDGHLELISGLTGHGENEESMASLGLYYSTVTDFLEFKRVKDEGKVVGMSSHGSFNPQFYQLFYDLIKGEGYHTRRISHATMIKELYQNFFNLVGDGFWKNKKQDLAFNAQLALETRVVEIVQALHEEFPNAEKIVLSGGVFANIKVNKRINDLEWVKEVFVMPPMGDEGISMGACMGAYKLLNPDYLPEGITNVFLGSSFSPVEVLDSWNDSKFTISKYSPTSVAKLIEQGNVIGFFQDGYEHGPRALGNRSIVAHPGLESTYKKVNDRLQRNDFMPFAPSVLAEHAQDIFKCEKSSFTGEFMTMLYDTKEDWVARIPAVVHPKDKTARAQIVREESNPKFHRLISEFYALSGIPLLLNTSFNVHEEPIVCKPQEAFRHLESGILDGLVIGDFFFKKVEND